MSNEHLGSMPPGLSIGAWGAPAGMIPVPSVSAQTTSMPNQRERLSPRTPVPVVSNVGCGGNAMQQGVPPLPGGFPASAARGPRVEELLVEQNRLLLGLLQAQQAVAPPSSSSCSAKPFVDPKKVLEEVDPELRKLLQEFETETKNLFSAWATQKAMKEKYARLNRDHCLHPHFEAEAKHQWQWTKLYMTEAQPLTNEGSGMADHFDLKEAWSAMRRRHAKECFEFVCQHQEKCVEMYDNLVKLPVLQQKLDDRLNSWFSQHGYDDHVVQETLKSQAKLFVECLMRAEFPKAKTRVEKEKELQTKRDAAVLEATEQWQSLDVKDVLSPALFELAKLGSARKPTKLKGDSALAYLVQDNPEICQKYNLKIVSPDAKDGRARKQTTPKQKRKGTPPRSRGRSPGSSSSRSSRTSRPRSILKHGNASSRDSSKTSSNARSKSVRFSDGKEIKGKGKGKGKGISKSKSKRK